MRKRRKKENTNSEDKLNDVLLLVGNNEIKTEKKTNIGRQSVSIPVYQKRIEYFEYDFLKTYLYSLYTGLLKNPEISVINLNTPVSAVNQALMPPNIIFNNEDSLPSVSNDTVHTNLIYRNCNYQVSISYISSSDGFQNNTQFFVSVSGTEPLSNQCVILADNLIRQAIKNSRFRNKILKMEWDYEGHLRITEHGNNEFRDENLDKVFIPQNVKSELKRFGDSILHYGNKNPYSLRCLISGIAGTGKTKCIRSIINLCYGKTTIILPSGMVNFNALFSFAGLFPSALICLDDVDLFFGDRYQSFSLNNLSDLLQVLDGLIKDNSVFLLGSTNDKELVDSAARRPGRFDIVLDFKELDKENYYDIICANTKDEEILNLFDDSTIEMFGKSKLPGSFIVNLIKQVSIMKSLYPNCSLKEYLQEYFKFSYNGFYRNNAKEQDKFGFTN